MMLGVQLARLVAVVLRVEMVGVGDVGVVGGPFMVARLVGPGCCVVVPGGMLMVRGGVPVVLDLFFVRHGISG
jgi:hypothetical protein